MDGIHSFFVYRFAAPLAAFGEPIKSTVFSNNAAANFLKK
jgi:hypothetical protein